ncbi:FeoB-associated Cys-rich membrane protein [Amphibacillus sp. MSJ-3]|nr:FeoB-associated Cys-rich membrane protein [Amphibacillus sp. MSJ-3]MBU5595252.1 FeoB-associated Cys-rich membrane protein [Amphibacillus sp. MSJ-3]
MATIILGIFIFGFSGWVIYRQFKGNGSCDACNLDCNIKQKQDKS